MSEISNDEPNASGTPASGGADTAPSADDARSEAPKAPSGASDAKSGASDAVPITPGLVLAGILAVAFGIGIGLLMSTVSLAK